MSEERKMVLYRQKNRQIRFRRFVKENLWMALAGALLVYTMVLLVSLAGSHNPRKEAQARQALAAAEARYVAEIRGTLKEAGYKNSGITLTKTADPEEGTGYTVTVHDDRLEKLDESGREKVLNRLEKVALPEGACSGKVLLYVSHV